MVWSTSQLDFPRLVWGFPCGRARVPEPSVPATSRSTVNASLLHAREAGARSRGAGPGLETSAFTSRFHQHLTGLFTGTWRLLIVAKFTC